MNQHILQVSELTKKVRFILESELNTVWLCGEVSNFIAASSGHWYLSLKDSKSQVKCAMFKGNNRKVRLSSGLPRNGQQVLVRAKVSLYEPRGDFQLIIEQLDDAGEGVLRQQFDQLKNKLYAEGLFELSSKKEIPKNITTIGIVTSPTGAAIKDILSVLKRRNPLLNVIIYPALVQGNEAKFEIEQAINTANYRKECDILIVGRGGGSLEDLWSFNEENVVRAIYHSKIPVISAVGHEIDTTLSDYTADLRAPTPSAAAELVSSNIEEKLQKLTTFNQRIRQASQRNLLNEKNRLGHIQHRLSLLHPAQKLTVQQQKFDELSFRLNHNLQQLKTRLQLKNQQLNQRLLLQSPLKNIQNNQQKVNALEVRLINAIQATNKNKQNQFKHTIEQLHIVSPLATIVRGYSVTKNAKGKVITSIEQARIDEKISVQVTNGFISAIVTQLNKHQ
ncbi:exodeoxyribonuclease VII large subunit [Pseudocolwellia agarivorans]|uniref:exodeoxyribonuclease VII large subunit n=1 Tax=Pseudocolwellia agarivorans TaxID=1911682 RepID=UPI0009864919|nr:exodeoxyribonuclease VII large subunit [Pseudocolwellia agarivorans]